MFKDPKMQKLLREGGYSKNVDIAIGAVKRWNDENKRILRESKGSKYEKIADALVDAREQKSAIKRAIEYTIKRYHAESI